tara:strand:+ start:56 stop:604 length:549 start_codon:yes stop_codon:yes gene_type:complete
MFYKIFSPYLVSTLFILAISFVFSKSLVQECENFDVNYKDNNFLTDREQVQEMDDALLESLNRFEECIRKKSTARKNISDNGIKNSSNGSEKLRGEKFNDMQETTNSYNEINQKNSENSINSSLNENNVGTNGKIPEDIPIDNNDDVFARQIKNAALKEKDPERQKKIWNQYRKYKNLPLED